MRLFIIYPPFAPATAAPYSPAALKATLQQSLTIGITCLDLNAAFHRKYFSTCYTQLSNTNDIRSYGKLLEQFASATRATATENNKHVVAGEQPELFQELLQMILDKKPDLVGFSIVYSSQCFYAKVLIDAILKQNIPCIMGGPAVNAKFKQQYTCLQSEHEMIEYLIKKGAKQTEKNDAQILADFNDFKQEEYFSKACILPIKTCSTCFYKQCTFCTHFARVPYEEYSINKIKETIMKNNAEKIFFIDDMIATPRLLELAEMLKPLNVTWWCQLRPTKDLLGKLKTLYNAGLRSVAWGVESGSQRVLNAMKKGTVVEDVENVLQESRNVGINNMVYIMFGFPTETKEEFLETINFLKKNDKNVDLVSTSVFGLQHGSKVYETPELFGVNEITEEQRTVLDGKITYRVTAGLQNEEAKKLKDSYSKTIRKIDKMPRQLAYFKEQVLAFL